METNYRIQVAIALNRLKESYIQSKCTNQKLFMEGIGKRFHKIRENTERRFEEIHLKQKYVCAQNVPVQKQYANQYVRALVLWYSGIMSPNCFIDIHVSIVSGDIHVYHISIKCNVKLTSKT